MNTEYLNANHFIDTFSLGNIKFKYIQLSSHISSNFLLPSNFLRSRVWVQGKSQPVFQKDCTECIQTFLQDFGTLQAFGLH